MFKNLIKNWFKNLIKSFFKHLLKNCFCFCAQKCEVNNNFKCFFFKIFREQFWFLTKHFDASSSTYDFRLAFWILPSNFILNYFFNFFNFECKNCVTKKAKNFIHKSKIWPRSLIFCLKPNSILQVFLEIPNLII